MNLFIIIEIMVFAKFYYFHYYIVQSFLKVFWLQEKDDQSLYFLFTFVVIYFFHYSQLKFHYCFKITKKLNVLNY